MAKRMKAPIRRARRKTSKPTGIRNVRQLVGILSRANGNIGTLMKQKKISISRPLMNGMPLRLFVDFKPNRMAFHVFPNGKVEIDIKNCITIDKPSIGNTLIQNTETIQFVRKWMEEALARK